MKPIASTLVALAGLGLFNSLALAALPNEGKPAIRNAAPQRQDAPREPTHPVVAPDACAGPSSGIVKPRCAAYVQDARSGAKVRVISIYNVTKVSVCMPHEKDCTAGR
ncbi:MAG TPA: hypothetical protein PKW21_07060 [Rhabdaerophilum sp.]|nr:hypothetical protein [Rhabdaerophilum sp.]